MFRDETYHHCQEYSNLKPYTIRYDEEQDGDLESNLEELSNFDGTMYYRRKPSHIGGIILAKALREEIKQIKEAKQKTDE